MNAASFDGVALELQGISFEILRPGYTVDYNDCRTKAHQADGITKKKAVVIITNYPAPPTDTAAWAKTNANFGVLARCLKDAGWVGLFHDPEQYFYQDGSFIAAPDFWNYGWWHLFRDPANLEAWTTRYDEHAKIISDNFPGMVYGWYHPATVADNSTPAEYRQSPNDLQTLGAAYAGMVNAIAAGRANLSLVDMGEVYSGTGAAFYKGFAEYRRNTVQNNLPTLSAAGRAAYSSIIQIGFMRFANYSLTTTSASGVTQELGEMWPYMTANGISGYYDESNFTQIPGFITDGVKAFNDAGRR